MDNLQNWAPETLAQASRAPGTLRGYAANWRSFSDWCAARGLLSLPAAPETVGAYIADQGQILKPATIDRHLSAIIVYHQQAGHRLDRHTPAIRDVFCGLRRRVGTASQGKAPLVVDDLRAVVAGLPCTRAGLRDRAILLIGFGGAFRRSELADLEMRDLLFSSEGLVVTVRRSKEDQEAKGMVKGIPFGQDEATCPVRTLRRWIVTAQIDDGAVFRRIDRHDRLQGHGLSGAAIADIVKRAVRNWGEREGWSKADIAAAVADTAGHSLRSGFCTSAAEAGATEWQAMQVSGHKRADLVRRYARSASTLRNPVLTRIGL